MSDDAIEPGVLAAAERVVGALETVVLGQRDAAEGLVAAWMAGGHALVEGVPGIGKTLLARAFASALGVRFSRVQFTPDLMPTDLMGMNVFDPPSGTFRLVRGPVFTEILMADEINRTPPKTQSALLEAMEERQVTIDGVSHALDPDASFCAWRSASPPRPTSSGSTSRRWRDACWAGAGESCRVPWSPPRRPMRCGGPRAGSTSPRSSSPTSPGWRLRCGDLPMPSWP
jgi:hypothetical protein